MLERRNDEATSGNLGRRRNRLLRALFARDGMWCWICHEFLDASIAARTNPRYVTADHYIPRSLGGANGRENIRLAHKLCNNRRSNRIPNDVFPYREPVICQAGNGLEFKVRRVGPIEEGNRFRFLLNWTDGEGWIHGREFHANPLTWLSIKDGPTA